MPQPVSDNITSTPSQPGQPYDAADPSHGPVGRWAEVEAGPCNINTGACEGEGGWDAPGPWMQT